jgi:phosphoribosylformimino-5-aminoimidazole carboxamide ribotide isomerase
MAELPHSTPAHSTLEIIPVLDLQGGRVVHARQGQRDQYHPLASPLAEGSDPAAVLADLLVLHPFRTIYLADLDALAGTSDHYAQVIALSALHPTLIFWLDASCRTLPWPYAQYQNIHPVLGTESYATADPLLALLREIRPEPILSLDYRGTELLGASALWGLPHLWPERIIALTLSQVGAAAGPDWERLKEIRAKAPKAALYAAGGVRHEADLAGLAALGVQGALVATALHQGTITAATLRRYAPPAGDAESAVMIKEGRDTWGQVP